MTTARILCAAVVLLGSALPAGCGDLGSGPPGPATATVALASAVTDGAILLHVTGPRFESTPLPARPGLRLYSRQVSESELVVVVFGPIASGPLFQVDIPDGRMVSGYAASILQVADAENALRADVSGYSVSMTAERRKPGG
jgi:hypothetical protein